LISSFMFIAPLHHQNLNMFWIHIRIPSITEPPAAG
jgi:hypothetical protein